MGASGCQNDQAVSSAELRALGPQRVFSGRNLAQVAFPLGGIGTGSVSLAGTGALVDWEIFNRPNIGAVMPYSFFTLWAQAEGKPPVTKVVQSPTLPPFSGQGEVNFRGVGFGVSRENGAGLPHFQSATFHGEVPLAWIDFADAQMPVEARLEAYNPFIPLNDRDSGLPVASFHLHLRNPGDETVRVSLAANLYNAVGYPGEGPFSGSTLGLATNTFVDRGGIRGLYMTSDRYPADDPKFGSLALSTPWEDVDHQTCWFRGGWYDALHKFWDEFSVTGTLQERTYETPSPDGQGDVGSIVLK
ncbi:MAG: hypothetical protein ISS56_16905, partial [Anaerolineae bacterium]|nr:hypothetical protein [Anaerolineae bacterium]